jgi:serine/threonine-protein kinase HipA
VVVAEELAVWLYGARVAVIDRDRRGRPTLQYTDEALRRYALGTPLLSLAMPLARQRYPQGVTRAFLDGLLPEGEPRTVIAIDVGVDRDDTFGLIRELGRDCAGAVVIQPADDPAPAPASVLSAEGLDEVALEELVANLRSAPLGVSGRVRVSLAGIQEKLLLTRGRDGRWGRPVDGTPSTHILKPEIAAYPDTVQNEAFCMRFARHLDVPTAPVETTVFGKRPLIIVERYDRVVHDDGAVERIHQEDFCQAIAVPPQRKYQEDGGPSLRRIAEILQAAVSVGSLERLLQAVTINVLVANGDAHGKNFSLLHDPGGALRFAPLYDVICTLVYGDDDLAMYIDNVHRTSKVTSDRLINEAASWGFPRRRAHAVVASLLDAAPRALEVARDETPGVPDDVAKVVHSQLDRLRETLPADESAARPVQR